MPESNAAAVRFLGNAGVELTRVGGDGRTTRVYIDGFFQGVPWVGSMPLFAGDDALPADIILVTHDHRDHFDSGKTARAARRSGATVIGPQAVTVRLSDVLPPEKLVTLEPPERRRPYAATVWSDGGKLAVTAYRTRHGPAGHNSYLIEFPGWRALHDGDNERTQSYDVPVLGAVDALFLCPWRGSGAGKFVRELSPRHWYLIHLTDAELAEHRRGEFLPGLFDGPPPSQEAEAGATGETLMA